MRPLARYLLTGGPGTSAAELQTGSSTFGSTTGVNATAATVTPSCMDGIQNQGEGGVDCGGPCAMLCSSCMEGECGGGGEGFFRLKLLNPAEI